MKRKTSQLTEDMCSVILPSEKKDIPLDEQVVILRSAADTVQQMLTMQLQIVSMKKMTEEMLSSKKE